MSDNGQQSDENALGHELSLWVVLYHDAIARQLGLNATEHKVLDFISHQPGTTPGELAAFTRLSNAAVTKIVNRLVESSYVKRRPASTDKRSFNLNVTPYLTERMGDIYASVSSKIAEGNATFTPEQLNVISQWLEMTIKVLREETIRLAEQR